MTDNEYFSSDGLSYSGMRDLSVSPLRYWHLHINPDRPEPRDTPEMLLGRALHCLILDPVSFSTRYYTESEIPEDALNTMDDMRQWCRDKGHSVTAKTKAELIGKVLAIDPAQPIRSLIEEHHEAANEGKEFLFPDQFQRVIGMASEVANNPTVMGLVKAAEKELPLFAKCPSTGVQLKCRVDALHPQWTLDFKTFSQSRGKSIDKAVNDAIYYERYHWQAYLYTLIRSLLGHSKTRYMVVFVESDPPHEVRIRELRARTGEIHYYWERARVEVTDLIETYAQYSREYGLKPWRDTPKCEMLTDENIPQVTWS